jgi:ethanolamine ammonia-lyase small subunit
MRTLATTPALAAVLTAGCSSGSAVEDPPASADDVDVTEDLQAAAGGESWAQLITEATRSEADRLEVRTTVVDPRAAGSPDTGRPAIDICSAAVQWLQAQGAGHPDVTVMEADGSTDVVFGHPSYPGGCTEV